MKSSLLKLGLAGVIGFGALTTSQAATKLDMATLKRYKRHFRLKTRQNVTKTELALAVAKHFASTTVDEADTIGLFMYVSSYGKMQKPGARATIDY